MKVGKREEVEKLASSYSRSQIARILGISRQRVCQILGVRRHHGLFGHNRSYKRLVKCYPRIYGIRHNKDELFWEKVQIGNEDDCWPWMGAKTPLGYGRANQDLITKKHLYAHIRAYELSHNVSASGLCVCHKCDNPPCCNPNHLFLGSMADNIHDRDAKGRNGKKGKFQKFCKRGHEFNAENIYVYPNGVRLCKECKKIRDAKYLAKKKAIRSARFEFGESGL